MTDDLVIQKITFFDLIDDGVRCNIGFGQLHHHIVEIHIELFAHRSHWLHSLGFEHFRELVQDEFDTFVERISFQLFLTAFQRASKIINGREQFKNDVLACILREVDGVLFCSALKIFEFRSFAEQKIFRCIDLTLEFCDLFVQDLGL